MLVLIYAEKQVHRHVIISILLTQSRQEKRKHQSFIPNWKKKASHNPEPQHTPKPDQNRNRNQKEVIMQSKTSANIAYQEERNKEAESSCLSSGAAHGEWVEWIDEMDVSHPELAQVRASINQPITFPVQYEKHDRQTDELIAVLPRYLLSVLPMTTAQSSSCRVSQREIVAFRH